MSLTNDERLNRAIEDESVPRFYFNGFVFGTGQADIVAVIERNNAPVAVINMSYTVAKTFALKLGQTIAAFEESTGREMLTTDEVQAKLTQMGRSKQ